MSKKSTSIEVSEEIIDLMWDEKFEEVKALIPADRHLLYLGTELPFLSFAVSIGACVIVEYLLDGGADIELRETEHGVNGYTPLQCAAEKGRHECCELLLNRGANIKASSRNGEALMIASAYGRESVCKLLVDRGADVNACDDAGWTALHWAAEFDNVPIANLLLAAGARLEKNKKGYSPVDRSKRTVKLLLIHHVVTMNLSGVIARGLSDYTPFTPFLIDGIYDPRLFLIVANFAFELKKDPEMRDIISR